MNRKPISRFITATEAEYESIAGDGTPYVFTDKEVRLTGFPRHDRLLRIARGPRVLPPIASCSIMPTWRHDLVGEATQPGDDRPAHPGFWDSLYAPHWLELLESERLRALADRAGLRIAFVPHPNMSVFLDEVRSPPMSRSTATGTSTSRRSSSVVRRSSPTTRRTPSSSPS